MEAQENPTDMNEDDQMTDDLPKPPPEEDVKKSSKFKAFMNARNHSIFGHFALAFALLSPIVSYFLMLMPIAIILFVYLITSREGAAKAEAFLYVIFIIPLILPVLICILLGVQSIRFGIKECRKWLITEGIVAIIVGITQFLVFQWSDLPFNHVK